jgi:hypothetical protein
VTAAWAAIRVKTSYLRAQFLRIKARRGAKKAILAVAASMLTAAHHFAMAPSTTTSAANTSTAKTNPRRSAD